MSDTPSVGTESVSLRAGGVIVEATPYGFIDLTTPPEPSSSVVNIALASVSVSTVIDSFVTGLDKANRWQYSSAATVWDSATQSVKIPCTSSYWSLQTAPSYDFTGSYLYAKVIPATGGTGTRETLMEVLGLDLVNNKISFQVSGATLFARKTSGGVNTAVFNTTYDPVNHLWLRLREAAGTTFYDTSPDGHTWTNLASTPNVTWDIAHIAVSFASGYYGTESAADTFIDSVNFPTADMAGSAGGVATVTGDLGVARALRGVSEGPVNATLLEPFDNLNAWTITAGAPVIIAGGRNGNGLRINSVLDSVDYTIPVVSESASITVGFALFQTVNTATSDFAWFRSDAGATDHIRVRANSDGGIWVLRGGSFLLASAVAGTIVLNTWQYVEIQLVLSDTVGSVIIRINGTVVASGTGLDTKNAGTKTTIDTFRLTGIGSAATTTYDDLYVGTGSLSTFKGDLALPLPGITGTLTVARGLAGQSNGVATAAAPTMALLTALMGRSDGLATITGLLGVPRALSGQSDGVATAGAPVMAVARGLSGVAGGASLVTGAMVTAMALGGRSDGAGVASGTGPNVLRPLSATAGGVGDGSATMAVSRALAGAAGGGSVSTGAIVRAVGLAGRSDGLGTTVSDMGQGFVLLAGQSAGQATAVGSLSVARALAARADGVSTANSALLVARAFSGQANGSGAATGFMIVAYALVGLSAGEGTAVGTVIRDVHLAGASVGMSAVGAPALSVLNGRVFVWRGMWVPQTPETSPLLVWNGTQWAEDAEVWDGTRWVPLNPVWV